MGEVNCQVATTNGIGGIVGVNCTSGSETNPHTTVHDCYNSGTVTSKGTKVGGICGLNYDYIKDCQTLSSSIGYSKEYGDSSNNYFGKIIGDNQRTNTSSVTYVSGNISTDSAMEVVYNVLNELNNEDSQIWSKSSLNEPKLLWEEK